MLCGNNYSSQDETVRSTSKRGQSQSGSEGLGGETDKEACTIHAINISSQRQYFVARRLISSAGNCFDCRNYFICTLRSRLWFRLLLRKSFRDYLQFFRSENIITYYYKNNKQMEPGYGSLELKMSCVCNM